MRWPFVSRVTLDRAEAVCRAMRDVQDANLTRERHLHDTSRAEVARLTSLLAEIASQHTKREPLTIPGPAKLPDAVDAMIARIAAGDTELTKLLRRRASTWRKARPDISDAELAQAIYVNELPAVQS